jgi:hypothetical protein
MGTVEEEFFAIAGDEVASKGGNRGTWSKVFSEQLVTSRESSTFTLYELPI